MTEQRTAGRFFVAGIIAFVLLAALLLTLAILSTIKGVRTAQSTADVVRVQDGQTVVVNMDGTEETVTLAGVLAPLQPAGGDASAENCLAEESAEHLAEMLEPGDPVQLEFPDDADGPGGIRLALARSGGQVINVAQVEAGLAVPVPEQPLEQLRTELREAQETARSEQSGLYSASVDCTLAGRVTPVIAVLEGVPGDRPENAEEADQRIEAVGAAVEQGVTVEKVFGTIDPEGSSLSSLAWADDVPRLRERLDEALSGAESELASLQSTRNVLLTRERQQAQREAEEARLDELARQRETARQAEADRQEQAARQAEAARREAARQADAEEAQRRSGEEDRREREGDSASATPRPGSPSPRQESSSPPSSGRPAASSPPPSDSPAASSPPPSRSSSPTPPSPPASSSPSSNDAESLEAESLEAESLEAESS